MYQELTQPFSVLTDSIESTGAYKPEELLPEAISIMLHKIGSVEACMRARFPGLVPPPTEAQYDAEEAAANEAGATQKPAKGRSGKKSKK